MSGNEEWGGLIVLAALAFGGYWVFDHYEIREKVDPEPVPFASLAPSVEPTRPKGMIDVSEGKEGIIYRLNADSVRGDRKNRQGWFIEDASKDKSTNWRFHHVLYLVDCDTTAIRQLSSIYYDSKGRSKWRAENTDPNEAKPEFYPEGTIGYAPIKALCAGGFDALN